MLSRHIWPALAFSDYVAVVLRNARDHQEVATEARFDWLTGLLTRRHFERDALTLLAAICGQRPSTLLLVDVDHFKQVNDQFGHTAGDSALREVATICRAAVRESDLAGRLGGDELAIFLPGSELQRAIAVAQTIRIAVEQLAVQSWPTLKLTVSIGLFTSNQSRDLYTEMFNRADDALYRSKNSGRNQVQFN